jgi:hypothetical protein
MSLELVRFPCHIKGITAVAQLIGFSTHHNVYFYFRHYVQTILTSPLVTEGFSCQVKRSEPEADYLRLSVVARLL